MEAFYKSLWMIDSIFPLSKLSGLFPLGATADTSYLHAGMLGGFLKTH